MWPSGDYWKPVTYDSHSSYGKYYAVDFYYSSRNRPDTYLNNDAVYRGRPILAAVSGDLFMHLFDVTDYEDSDKGNFPLIDAVRVIQGFDPVPMQCFSMKDQDSLIIRIDMSLVIDFNSNKNRLVYSHLQIDSSFFTEQVQQKIRDAIRKFYYRTAPGNPKAIAISLERNISVGSQVGTINDWGIATSGPHLHFQVRQGLGYSEEYPVLGPPLDLSNSSLVTIESQVIFPKEYEGKYGSKYHYPAMLRRSYSVNSLIIANSSWDKRRGVDLRESPAGTLITTIPDGTVGYILQSKPQYAKLDFKNYIWYNVRFGNISGWVIADHIEPFEGAGSTYPDLYVDVNGISIIPIDNIYQINVVVQNLGASANNVEVLFIEYNLENNRQSRIGQVEIISDLGSNQQVTVTKNYTPSSANCKIIVIIDPQNKIAEINEQNNSAEKLFTLQKPTITSVTAKYDGNPNPDIIGRFIAGLKNTWNTFYATVTGDVERVEFILNDQVIVDDNPNDGWSATFDMGSLPAGLNNLIVKAYSSINIASLPVVKKIKVENLPEWVTRNFQFLETFEVNIDNAYLNFALKLKSLESQGGGPFSYIARINKEVMFLPKESIEAESDLWFIFGIPLDETLSWKLGGRFSLSQKILGRDVGNTEAELSVILNADNSLNSFLLLYEKEALLFGVEVKQKYPLVPGLNAVIGGGFDVYGKLSVQIVSNLIGNEIKFVVTPDGEKTRLSPGIGLKFNLIGGLEILFGIVSGELVLSPRFDLDIGATFVTYPINEGLKFTASGEGRVEWRVIGSVFWGAWERELYSGVFGPWEIFDTDATKVSMSRLHSQRLTYYEVVQLPTVLPLPSISTDSNGNVMVVWLEKEDDNSPPQIFYSFKPVDGNFSIPQPLVNNAFYKSDPKIVFNPDGTANAVWVQNSQTESFLATNPSLSEILRYQDIYYSYWDKSSWSTPILVTQETAGNEKSDGVPTIIVSPDNSEKLILWTRNVLDSSLQRTGLEIFYARMTSEGISAPLPLTTNSYADLMVRGCYYANGKALAIWVRDEDGDPETVNDNEIYYSKWSDGNWEVPQRLTNNLNQEKDLSIASLKDGRALATWVEIETLEDSTLRYYLMSSVFDPFTNSWSTPEVIHRSHHFIETPIVNVEARNIATVTWRGYYQNINGDILIALRDFRDQSSKWTVPKPISNDELIDWMIATAIDASSNQYFVHLKSSTDSLSGNQKINKPNFFGGLTLTVKGIKSGAQISDELNFSSYLIAADLVVDSTSITVVDSLLRENEISDVFIRIRNIGGISSESTYVRVYDGNPLQGGAQVIADIPLPKIHADSGVILRLPFLFKNINHIFVQIDPDSLIREQSKSNNLAGRTIALLPDLSVENVTIQFSRPPSINQTGTVSVVIKNRGQRLVDSVTVQFLEKSDDTSAVAQEWLVMRLQNLQPDSIYELSVPYVVVRNGTTHIYVNVDPDNTISEVSESNNTDSTLFKVLPDVQIDTLWFDLLSQNLVTVISNVGGDTAREFDISFYRGDPLSGGIRIGTIHIPVLEPNYSDTLFLSYTPNAGLSTVYAWIDSIGLLQELSVENNKTYVSFTVPGSVDLHPVSILADSYYPIGIGYPIIFKISNIGSSGTNSIEYQIIVKKLPAGRDSLIASKIISILNPQETYIDTLVWTFEDTSAIEFKVVVDPLNSIVEVNETNNLITTTVRGYFNHSPIISSTPITEAYEDSLYEYQIIATDIDTIYGDFLRYEIMKPEWMTFDTTNYILRGIPLQQHVGVDSIFIKVTDKGFASDSQFYALVIHPVNDAPIVSGIPDTSFVEDSSLSFDLDDYVTDEDNDDSELWWSVEPGSRVVESLKQKLEVSRGDVKRSTRVLGFAEGDGGIDIVVSQPNRQKLTLYLKLGNVVTDSLQVVIDSVTHVVTFISTLNFYGENLPFIFTATDPGGLSGRDTMLLTVMPVNDPPVLSMLPDTSFNEDDTLIFPLSLWYSYVEDVDNPDTVLSWVISAGQHVQAEVNSGIVRVGASPNWYGVDTLKVIVRDPAGLADTTDWRVTVHPVNDAPISFRLISPSNQDTIALVSPPIPITFIWHSSSDPDGDSLLYILTIKGVNAQYDTSVTLADTSISMDIMDHLQPMSYYSWFVRVTDRIDTINSLETFSFRTSDSVTAVWVENEIPKVFMLYQNYPNPFNPSTVIMFDLPREVKVKLCVYDVLGRLVNVLIDDIMAAGRYRVEFRGSGLPSGVYFYRLEAGSYISVKKMVLVK
jgi:subtilase family serine protease